MPPAYNETANLIKSIYTTSTYGQPNITTYESNGTSGTDHEAAEPPSESTVHTTSEMTRLALILVLIIAFLAFIWYRYNKTWTAAYRKYKKAMQAKEAVDLERAKEEYNTDTLPSKDSAPVISVSVSVSTFDTSV
ncbi:uncharacterized protein EAF01_007824 [Botrytis porri]|uniref:uncharacterized protein n=1 Tax=Botrytis porri TaxID=87229 RepID=UPI0019009329|nr:uncharacterized protein EAF01_007824 [Botrytis porri]KAF7900522.1 hypothetical protein EAF01_007824 [Botrytis porri]